MPGGRPPLFESKEYLEQRGEEYFVGCQKSGTPMTLSGLAYGLGCDTQTLRNYAEKDEFFGTIKRFKQRIEADKAAKLESKEYATAGLIFDLTNNHGFTNTQTFANDRNSPLTDAVATKEQRDAAVAAALSAKKTDS